MILLFYLPILALLGALFALGYFPVVVPGRWLMKRRLTEAADAWAPLGGVIGTVAGFLLAGLDGFDRFALAPDYVRATWRDSGSAFAFELWQPLFSGAVCAVALLMIARVWPRLAENQRATTGVTALLVSIASFSLWPVILSPLL
jgi:hypothetical protein